MRAGCGRKWHIGYARTRTKLGLYTDRREFYIGAAGMANQLDEAFNWLVLILITASGALSQFPEIIYFIRPETPVAEAVWLVRMLIFPVIVLVLIWLTGYLVEGTEKRVVLKSFSWVLALLILFYLLVFMLLSFISPGGPIEPSGPTQENLPLFMILMLLIISPVFLSPIIFHQVVRPRLKGIYQGSKFLTSLSQEALVYILAVLLYFLATGAIEGWV